jgi:hypothetical protein
VVLVEGPSDAAVLHALAESEGRSLGSERTAVIAMGGVTNIGPYLRRYRSATDRLSVAGLCDAGEERFVRRALQAEGLSAQTRQEMAQLGFYVCDADLEDEMLRALGLQAAEAVLQGEGELELFRRFQWQPAQRQRSVHDQLHRFAGTRSGRKVRLAGSMASSLPHADTPAPLRGLLDFIRPDHA